MTNEDKMDRLSSVNAAESFDCSLDDDSREKKKSEWEKIGGNGLRTGSAPGFQECNSALPLEVANSPSNANPTHAYFFGKKCDMNVRGCLSRKNSTFLISKDKGRHYTTDVS